MMIFRLEELDSQMAWFLTNIMYQCSTTRTAGPIASPRILEHGCFGRTRLYSDRARRRPV